MESAAGQPRRVGRCRGGGGGVCLGGGVPLRLLEKRLIFQHRLDTGALSGYFSLVVDAVLSCSCCYTAVRPSLWPIVTHAVACIGGSGRLSLSLCLSVAEAVEPAGILLYCFWFCFSPAPVCSSGCRPVVAGAVVAAHHCCHFIAGSAVVALSSCCQI